MQEQSLRSSLKNNLGTYSGNHCKIPRKVSVTSVFSVVVTLPQHKK